MKRCILCGRKISDPGYNFGLGCLKKMCIYTHISDVKSLKSENKLNTNISRICNKKSLLKSQKQLLTDRYLTLSLLNEVPLDYYDNYKNLLQNDIDNINNTSSVNTLPSLKNISLKEAFEINKKYKENKSIFQKIINGDYDTIQNISVVNEYKITIHFYIENWE